MPHTIVAAFLCPPSSNSLFTLLLFNFFTFIRHGLHDFFLGVLEVWKSGSLDITLKQKATELTRLSPVAFFVF